MKLNKTIFYILLGSVLTVSAVSCSNYLDTDPITERAIPLSDKPYTTAAEAESLMDAIYSNFANEYWQLDYFFNGDAQADTAYTGGDNPQNMQQGEYRIIATNTNVSRDWNDLYGFINSCNKVLNYVDNISDPTLTAARKKEMKAEASILRALYYFHAVQLWGDVPLVTKAVIGVNSSNFDEVYSQVYPKRATTAEVYTQIIADLEGAIANAPASSNKFRATKGAALALLAKVYATKPSPDYTKVVSYTDQLTAEGYSLLPNYDHLFDGAHEGNAESIFEANGNAGSIWAWSTFMFVGTDWKKFNTPTNDVVKTFNDEGDTVRKQSSVTFESVSWADNYWASSAYPFMNKQRMTDGTQNFYIVRYADMLLIKAEAKVQLGDYAGAATLVNQVRARVGLSPITISGKDDGINKILKERKMELAFEGERWFDLKRTGKAVEILSARKDGNGNVLSFAKNINANKLLWPIPQSQIDNNPNLTQNTGY
jgi:hypothetical protein